MRRSASTAPELGINVNALLLIGSILFVGRRYKAWFITTKMWKRQYSYDVAGWDELRKEFGSANANRKQLPMKHVPIKHVEICVTGACHLDSQMGSVGINVCAVSAVVPMLQTVGATRANAD